MLESPYQRLMRRKSVIAHSDEEEDMVRESYVTESHLVPTGVTLHRRPTRPRNCTQRGNTLLLQYNG